MTIHGYENKGRSIQLVYETVLDYYKIVDNQSTDYNNVVFTSKKRATEVYEEHISRITEVTNDVAL